MENKAIHQNLDTSYVNLSALIKYLRRRQFAGLVKVQLNGYKADIQLTKDNNLKVSEHDQISGRISDGEEALQRILIRSREPGGTINVYQLGSKAKVVEPKVSKVEVIEPKVLEVKKVRVPKPISAQTPKAESVLTNGIPKPLKMPTNAVGNNASAQNKKPRVQKVKTPLAPRPKKKLEKPESIQKIGKNPPQNGNKSMPDFPFRLSNKFEDKAREVLSSNQDWQTILNLMVELLKVTDKSFAVANINFNAAFTKVRSEVSDDYPFLSPNLDEFDYVNGKIVMTKQMNGKIFIAGIMESLCRVFEKLSLNSKYSKIHAATLKRISVVAKKRAAFYNKFSITPQIKRILSS